MKNICIFEDDQYNNFLPLVYTRPVYELICGMTSLREKIVRCFPGAKLSLHCREFIAPVLERFFPEFPVNRLNSESCLFINGRILPEKDLAAIFAKNGDDEKVFLKNTELIAIRLQGKRLEKIKTILKKDPIKLFSQLKQFIPEITQIKLNDEVNLVQYLWDLVNYNTRWISKDAQIMAKSGKWLTNFPSGVHLIHKKNIFSDRKAEISPGVVIDAKAGPVIIDRKVKIFPQVSIIGPVYIGEGSVLKAGAQIYAGTTIGKACKVGGEVADSIIHDFTNKQHHGFIGHSYLGSWINLGAGTSNSDLKNNYSPIKVLVNGRLIDTGSIFAGLFMGDHSKTAINTIFNTGTMVGISCNLFGSDFLPRFIPSFSWGEKEKLATHKLEKSIETAQRVMARRGEKLFSAEKKMFKKIFTLTRNVRREWKISK